MVLLQVKIYQQCLPSLDGPTDTHTHVHLMNSTLDYTKILLFFKMYLGLWGYEFKLSSNNVKKMDSEANGEHADTHIGILESSYHHLLTY